MMFHSSRITIQRRSRMRSAEGLHHLTRYAYLEVKQAGSQRILHTYKDHHRFSHPFFRLLALSNTYDQA